mmetsp:Transcript_119669/g.255359  ORF Transcript_119669/g.255359 Transcript_119669/m.255359 type:complete len:248 (+) Transcript_119669:2415-3158(+)
MGTRDAQAPLQKEQTSPATAPGAAATSSPPSPHQRQQGPHHTATAPFLPRRRLPRRTWRRALHPKSKNPSPRLRPSLLLGSLDPAFGANTTSEACSRRRSSHKRRGPPTPQCRRGSSPGDRSPCPPPAGSAACWHSRSHPGRAFAPKAAARPPPRRKRHCSSTSSSHSAAARPARTSPSNGPRGRRPKRAALLVPLGSALRRHQLPGAAPLQGSPQTKAPLADRRRRRRSRRRRTRPNHPRHSSDSP